MILNQVFELTFRIKILFKMPAYFDNIFILKASFKQKMIEE